ncbi:EI24 domain-containing protein [Janthinobacterium aquaticum]|uniref:EI24 domain-containing protein n=1 Tax=Janthinobacterium sp. FT58W TaxID=2654254 RepID=UPI001264867C|nr:EI24 domain-containing protein [Janthinobacterium sp. FT58W]KAB8042230.1 hypothetical protein GCM43_14240 [Janthinobacterium sp. FT58W]
MRNVFNSYGRALLSQLHGKMLLLSALPFLLSLLLWGLLLYWGLQPLIDSLQVLFAEHDLFRTSSAVLGTFGLGMLKTVIVPLIAMFMLLPLMILMALIFMGVLAMPAIGRHVGGRHFPQLEKKHGGSLLGSVGTSLATFLLFIVVWAALLPLYAFPPAALVGQALLWGWLTYRVMAYDAMADYASAEERHAIMRSRRTQLLLIGVVSGAAGAVPGMLWMGGVMSVVFFPFLAAFAIWLYVVIFIFTGLWFQYYCLEALSALRGVQGMRDVAAADA